MKQFKKYCISKELDGTEDDAVLSDCDESDFSDSDIFADIKDDAPTRAKDFYQLFGKSNLESELRILINFY